MATSSALLILAASFTQIEPFDGYSKSGYNIKLYTAAATIGPFLLTLCLLLDKASALPALTKLKAGGKS